MVPTILSYRGFTVISTFSLFLCYPFGHLIIFEIKRKSLSSKFVLRCPVILVNEMIIYLYSIINVSNKCVKYLKEELTLTPTDLEKVYGGRHNYKLICKVIFLKLKKMKGLNYPLTTFK